MEFFTPDSTKIASAVLTGLVALWTLLHRSNRALVRHLKAELSSDFATRAQLDAVSQKLDTLLAREWGRRRSRRGILKGESD